MSSTVDFTHLNLPREAHALWRNDMTAREFLIALVDHKCYVPGIEIVAHSLPEREGVWWGCVSLRHVTGGRFSDLDREALRASVQWIIDPSEPNRLNAKARAEAVGALSAAALLAAAAYQTGPDVSFGKSVPPARFAAAKTIANAVKLACTMCEPVQIVETQRLLVEMGMQRVQ